MRNRKIVFEILSLVIITKHYTFIRSAAALRVIKRLGKLTGKYGPPRIDDYKLCSNEEQKSQ